MLRLQQLRLAESVHLTAADTYSIIWPLREFRKSYAALASTMKASMSEEDACRLLVKSAGGDQGVVGSENVYGGAILQQLMDHKLEELAVGEKEGEFDVVKKDEAAARGSKTLGSQLALASDEIVARNCSATISAVPASDKPMRAILAEHWNRKLPAL
ncbi:unnamed protein product [Polarella glacialis]|uniref:Uncharacterized protein n=1 Tax=Polarella glacialis TaxID=89957 RepID=A0A813HEK3_POLGL|nr:unnamed protein product [Polarella glacialis]